MAELKGLIKLIDDLDLWLGKVFSASTSLQKDMFSLRSKLGTEYKDFKNTLVVPIDSVLHKSNELSLYIKDQVDSLKILKKAPPGFGSMILDFLHGVTVDPNAPSLKKTYYDKLRNLGKSFTEKEANSIGNMLNVPIDKPIMESLPKLLILPEKLVLTKDHISSVVAASISDIYADNENLNSVINRLKGVLTQEAGISSTGIGNLLLNFFDELEIRMFNTAKAVPPENKKKVELFFTKIRQVIQAQINDEKAVKGSNKASLTKSADINSLGNVIDNHLKVFQEFIKTIDSAEFVNRAGESIGTVSQKASKEDIDLMQRYFAYIKSVFDPSYKGVVQYIRDINDILTTIRTTVGNQPSDEKPQSDQSDQQGSTKITDPTEDSSVKM